MCPGVESDEPSECPVCGMALERAPSFSLSGDEDEAENPELVDMRRRLLISLVFSVPLFVLSMLPMVVPGDPFGFIPADLRRWIELALATPVVLWCGWPFLVRGLRSVQTWNLNMWTLIGLGVSVAYVYSVFTCIAPGLFPPALRGHGGAVAVYFEASATIISLVPGRPGPRAARPLADRGGDP